MSRAWAGDFVDYLGLPASTAQSLQHLAALSREEWRRALNWLDLGGLTLQFWNRLQQNGNERIVPAGLAASLQRNLADQQTRVAAMALEFDSINRCFGEAAIDHAVLKGFALVPDYCPDACWRTAYDYDFLVAPAHMPRAEQALRSLGYVHKRDQPGHSGEFYLDGGRPRQPAHRDEFYSSRLPRSIEIHGQLWDSGLLKFPLCQPGDPLGRRRLRSWQGLQFYSLAEEDELLFQLVHVFRHVLYQWCRLSGFLEIAYFLGRRAHDQDFWARFRKRIDGQRPLSEIAGLVFLMATGLFGVAGQPEMAAEMMSKVPKPLVLWWQHYGRASALDNFARNKYVLFAHREFVKDDAAWREFQQSRLMPLHRPNRPRWAPSSSLASRVLMRCRQVVHIAGRFAYHLKSGIAYRRESRRWQRLKASE